ncbi:MAG: STAS domain-containing protein [Candidatus Muiribacteriota bacterium]
MNITYKEDKQILIVSMNGNFKTHDEAELENLNNILNQGDFKGVIFNMRNLPYISGRIVDKFVQFLNNLYQKDFSIRLYQLRPYVKNILINSGLIHVLKVTELIEKGIKEIKQEHRLSYAKNEFNSTTNAKRNSA